MLTVKDLKDKIFYANTEIIPAFENAGQENIIAQLKECGNYIRLALCKSCGTKHYAGSNNCRSRYCPTCAKKRSMLWLAKLMPVFNDWLKHGGYICKMNLTIKDTDNLDNGINLMIKAWQRMTNINSNRKEFARRFAGGVRSLEIKKGENSKLWHPHFHTLVLKDHFEQDYEYMREQWERSLSKISGNPDKLGSVWLKGFKYEDAGSNDLLQAVLETFKYIVKCEFKDLAPLEVTEMVDALYKRKGVQTWGILFNYESEIEKDLENLTDCEIKDKVCAICGFNEFEFENIMQWQFFNDNTIEDLK